MMVSVICSAIPKVNECAFHRYSQVILSEALKIISQLKMLIYPSVSMERLSLVSTEI